MKNLTAKLVLELIDLKPRQLFSHHELTLSKDGVVGQPLRTTDDVVTFENLEPGVYTLTGFSVDVDGGPMGPVQTSNPFTVDPAAQAGVLSALTLSLG